MKDSPDARLRNWLEFYDELGLMPLFRGRGPAGRGSASPRREESPSVGPTREKDLAAPLPPSPSATPGLWPREASLFDGPKPKAETLEQIRADLGECTRCGLHQDRTHIVFGTGSPKAELVFVGEGPGADEDAQGLPFVGRAGRLLTKWIESIELTRDQVYICNVVKCRPPGNRTPAKDETQTCAPFLFRQLDAIRPRLICCLGATALAALLGKPVSIGKMRGQFFDYRGAKLLALYHPAYLLRPHPAKVDKELKQDLQKIRSFLDG